ncbi:hypothetical protein FRC11_014855 [Ceratobasidium sp. 423]|nr:hypothetical protein FRC11_014855 [Ceratobasidium sp. 423]
MHDLKTPEGVLAYLRGTRFSTSDVQTLSGGGSAFTYRAVLENPLECGRKTIVIKHFEGFVSHRNDVKASAERAVRLSLKTILGPPVTRQVRQEREYEALSAIAGSGLFGSDSRNLVVPSNSKEVWELTSDIGRALGDFMGRFHNWSALPEQAALHAYFAQDPNLNQRIMAVHHHFLNLSADRFKVRETWMDEFIAKDKQAALTDGGALVMGDCSLLSPPSEGRDMRIYLVDLEGARTSSPEVDIGELTASAVSFGLLYYPNSDRLFIPALHQAYSRHCTLDAWRFGILTGMDLMGFGPVLSWAKSQDETKLRGVAVAGLELLKFSIREDEELIKANPVMKHLFSPHSQPMI